MSDWEFLAVPKGLAALEMALLSDLRHGATCSSAPGFLASSAAGAGSRSGDISMTVIHMITALGYRLFAAAGSEEACRACEEDGAIRGINYRNEVFADVINDKDLEEELA